MSRFCPLFSSSSGNLIYIGGSQGAILVDAGVSAKQAVCAMEEHGIDPCSIQAIFVTHEHSDHVKGIRVLASRYHLPVFASCGTLEALNDIGMLDGKFLADAIPAQGMEIAGMWVQPFHTPHDSAESTGYVIELADERKVAIATDLGVMTREVFQAICGCDLVLLESNHDVGMLENGPYPYSLKRRILSNRGHLSNDACALTLENLLKSGTTRFVLGHLSRENNMPELAYQTAVAALQAVGAVIGEDYSLSVASPRSADCVTVF